MRMLSIERYNQITPHNFSEFISTDIEVFKELLPNNDDFFLQPDPTHFFFRVYVKQGVTTR